MIEIDVPRLAIFAVFFGAWCIAATWISRWIFWRRMKRAFESEPGELK